VKLGKREQIKINVMALAFKLCFSKNGKKQQTNLRIQKCLQEKFSFKPRSEKYNPVYTAAAGT